MDRICNRFSKSSDRFSESHSENKAKEYSEDLRKQTNKTQQQNKKKTKQEKQEKTNKHKTKRKQNKRNPLPKIQHCSPFERRVVNKIHDTFSA